ncbi:MAG: gatA, partial [Frankiales bacterium]|nr:gatA [Frankiales bacterium]
MLSRAGAPGSAVPRVGVVLTARALAAAVRSGDADPVDLVQEALERLGGDPLGAFEQVDAAAALEEAASRRGGQGPLQGVPVGVKDLYDVAGQVTRASSDVPAGAPAERDSTAVARLRAAGAVVLGRTRTHEFAWGITTQHPRRGGTANPHDRERVPGGSSGGSAAAVASGVVPLALGTDTGASIRLPAAWCGLVGFKPTHGAVPLDGVVPLAPSLDTGGAVVRDVEDARLAHEVLSGSPLDPPVPVRGLRLGVVTGATTAAVGDRLHEAAQRAVGAGLLLQDVLLPAADRVQQVYAAVQGAEALAWHRSTGRWPQHAQAYGDDVRALLVRCEQLTEDQVQQAQDERAALREAFRVLFTDVDLLLMPVAGCGPARRSDPPTTPDGSGPLRSAVLPWTVPANLAGLPACSVPAG